MKSGWFFTFRFLLLLYCLLLCIFFGLLPGQKKLKQRHNGENMKQRNVREDDGEEEVGETTHCGKCNYVNVAIESVTSTTAIPRDRNIKWDNDHPKQMPARQWLEPNQVPTMLETITTILIKWSFCFSNTHTHTCRDNERESDIQSHKFHPVYALLF